MAQTYSLIEWTLGEDDTLTAPHQDLLMHLRRLSEKEDYGRSYFASTSSGPYTPRSKSFTADVPTEVWLLTKLTAQLLWALRLSTKWIFMLLRLLLFILLCFPAFIRIFWYWLFHPNVHRNVIYGPQVRRMRWRKFVDYSWISDIRIGIFTTIWICASEYEHLHIDMNIL